jgi:hypothetical protein
LTGKNIKRNLIRVVYENDFSKVMVHFNENQNPVATFELCGGLNINNTHK